MCMHHKGLPVKANALCWMVKHHCNSCHWWGVTGLSTWCPLLNTHFNNFEKEFKHISQLGGDTKDTRERRTHQNCNTIHKGLDTISIKSTLKCSYVLWDQEPKLYWAWRTSACNDDWRMISWRHRYHQRRTLEAKCNGEQKLIHKFTWTSRVKRCDAAYHSSNKKPKCDAALGSKHTLPYFIYPRIQIMVEVAACEKKMFNRNLLP